MSFLCKRINGNEEELSDSKHFALMLPHYLKSTWHNFYTTKKRSIGTEKSHHHIKEHKKKAQELMEFAKALF